MQPGRADVTHFGTDGSFQLMNASTLDTIKTSAAVPSVPQVVLRFLEVLRDPSFDYGELVKTLSSDPGTVSEVLRLANSPLFGARQRIVSLRQALTLLGPKRTRSLLLGRYLVDTMSRKRVQGVDMGYFWRRSLACGVVAARLADTALPQYREESFIAGLLADVGIPILAEAAPDAYGEIASQFTANKPTVPAIQEHYAVGATHAEVSAMVLKHWSLPDLICTAVNLHQSDNPGPSDEGSLARLLNASDRIAKLVCEVPDTAVAAAECTQAMSFVGAPIEVLVKLLGTVQIDIEGMAQNLRITVLPGHVYGLIAQSLQQAFDPAQTSPA